MKGRPLAGAASTNSFPGRPSQEATERAFPLGAPSGGKGTFLRGDAGPFLPIFG